MKKVLLALVLVMCTVMGYAQTDEGDSSFGVNIGYGFDSENVTLGLDYRYNITDEIRLAPSITHYVKENYHSAWAIDMNAHYVVKLSDMFGFYPLAGLGLSFWKWSAGNTSANSSRFGANLGLGAEVYATPEITVGLEAKYTIIKDFDQALMAVRVGYNF